VGGAPVLDHPVDHPVVQEAEAQLRRWEGLCAEVAGDVRRARDVVGGLLPPRPGVRPTGFTSEEARRRDAVRARWTAHVAAYLATIRSDPDRLARWWQGLDDSERAAILEHHPDLFDGPLAQLLTDPERRRLAAIRREIGGRQADELQEALRHAGLDPGRFRASGLLYLDSDDPRYRQVLDVLARIAAGHGPDQPDWAIGFYGKLGVDGTRRLFELLDLARRRTPQRVTDLVPRYATAFGIAAGAPELARIRDDLVNDAYIVDRTALDIVLAGDLARYDPGFVTQAARKMILKYPTAQSPLAYRALAANPEAARQFVLQPDGSVGRQAVRALVDGRVVYGGGMPGEFKTIEVGPDAATALGHVIFDQHDRPGSNLVYFAVIDDLGAPPGKFTPRVSVEAKRVAARSLVFYADEIGQGAILQMESNPADNGPGRHLSHPEVVRFFAALATDEQAAAAVGISLTQRGIDIVNQVPIGAEGQPASDPDHLRHVAELRRLAFTVTAARHGFDQARADGVDQAAAGYAGVRLALGAAAVLPAGASVAGTPVVAYAGQVTAYGANMMANDMTNGLNADAIAAAKAQYQGGNKLEIFVLSGLQQRLAERAPNSSPADPKSDHAFKSTIDKIVSGSPIEEAFNDAMVNRAARLGPVEHWGGGS
jgi:hypothetical protein